MKKPLNYWQTSLLFLPFMVSCIFISLNNSSFYGYQTSFAIANFLLVVNICVVINYQAYLAIQFNKLESKSKAFAINALIPIAFFGLYLLYVTYLTFNKAIIHSPKFKPGPLTKASFNSGSWVILMFMLYAFVNFYFINNNFVANKIKLVQDIDKQQLLKDKFLSPMKRLTRISIWIVVIGISLSVILDIIKLTLGGA